MELSQSGGKLLGVGAYGCVFTPPLLSVGEKQLKPEDRKLTAKLMSVDIGEREAGIGDLLSKIPFTKNYFVYTTSKQASTPAPASAQHEPDLALCEKTLEEALDRLKLYKMPYGGTTLYETNLKVNEFNLWEFGKHLLEALTILITHGIVHTDLHSKNILIDEHYVPRIIDWGVSMVMHNVNDEEIKSLVDPSSDRLINPQNSYISQSWMPPEIILFIAEKNNYNRSEIIEAIIKNSNRKVIGRALNYLFDITDDDLIQQLEEFQKTSSFFAFAKNDGALAWYKSQGQYKYDSWGIGIYIVKIIRQLGAYSNILSQPRYRQKKAGMLAALRGLCSFNPKTRINPVKALSMWDSPDNKIIKRFGAGWI